LLFDTANQFTFSLYKRLLLGGQKKKMSCYTCFGVAKHCCQNCQKAKYCSKKCQILDWSVHKHECYAKRKAKDDGKKEETKKKPKVMSAEEKEAKIQELFTQMRLIEDAYRDWSMAELREEVEKEKALLNSYIAAFSMTLENSSPELLNSERRFGLLERAVYTRYSPIVSLLLKNGAIPKEYVLVVAAEQRLLRIVRLLLENHEFEQETKDRAFSTAIFQFDIVMAEYLAQKGAKNSGNIDVRNFFAKYYNEPRLKDVIVRSTSSQTLADWFLHIVLDGSKTRESFAKLTELVKLGADMAIIGKYIFYIIRQKGVEKLITAMVEAGVDVNAQDDVNNTPLHYAALTSNVEMVKLLLDAGAIIEARNAAGKTALHLAIQNSNEEVVKFLLSKNAKVPSDYSGITPLDEAIEDDDEELAMKVLLENPRMPTKRFAKTIVLMPQVALQIIKHASFDVLNFEDDFGNTPLSTACMYGKEQVALAILETDGIDLDVKNGMGHVAIHSSITRNMKKVFVKLIEKGADINITNDHDQTPLMLAILYGKTEYFALELIRKGAYLDAVDEKGKTALDYAIEKNRTGVQAAIRKKR